MWNVLHCFWKRWCTYILVGKFWKRKCLVALWKAHHQKFSTKLFVNILEKILEEFSAEVLELLFDFFFFSHKYLWILNKCLRNFTEFFFCSQIWKKYQYIFTDISCEIFCGFLFHFSVKHLELFLSNFWKNKH